MPHPFDYDRFVSSNPKVNYVPGNTLYTQFQQLKDKLKGGLFTSPISVSAMVRELLALQTTASECDAGLIYLAGIKDLAAFLKGHEYIDAYSEALLTVKQAYEINSLQNINFVQAVQKEQKDVTPSILPQLYTTPATVSKPVKTSFELFNNAFDAGSKIIKQVADYALANPGKVMLGAMAIQATAAAAHKAKLPSAQSELPALVPKVMDDYSLQAPAKIPFSLSPILPEFNSLQERINAGLVTRSISKRVVNEEFAINTHTSSLQIFPSVSSLSNGNFVVVWQSYLQDGSSYGIYGQIFNPTGTKIGSEFQINTYINDEQAVPSVSGLSNGNFVVTWHSNLQDGTSYGVYGQIFSPTGTKAGSEFRINTYTIDDQSSNVVSSLSNGNFVVAWSSNLQDGSSYGVYGQIFSPTGTKVGSELQINTYTLGFQAYPSVSNLSNGNFVVAWHSNLQDGSVYGIYGQVFDPAGAKIGTEFQINTYTADDQTFPSVSSLSNGNFVVAWQSNLQDGSAYGIYGQIFSPAGARLGGEFKINTYTSSIQEDPSLSSLSNTNFVVVWHSNGQDGSGYGIYGQVFSSLGAKVGVEFQLNTYTADSQSRPSVSSLSNGNFVVAWNSNGQDGSSWGIYGKIINTSISVINDNQAITYIEDASVSLNPIIVQAPIYAEQVTVKLTLSIPSVGRLTIGTIGTATSTFNATTGVWQASGKADDINRLLAVLQFVPALNYNSNFSMAVSVSDGINAAVNNTITVQGTAVNDLPQLVNNQLSISEGQTVLITSAQLSATDVDDAADGLIFTISNLQHGAFVQASNSAITVSSFTQLQVKNGQIAFRHDGSETEPSYSISVSDGKIATAAQSATIIFDSSLINDSPDIYPAVGTQSYLENAGPQAIDPQINVRDVDSPQLVSALVAITSNFNSAQDRLNVINQNNITGNYNAAQGTLTLNGADSVANYQAALRGVTYENLSDNPTTGDRNITFTVNDGSSNSDPVIRTVNVQAINDAPVLLANQLAIDEGQTVILSLANLDASDVDNTAPQIYFAISNLEQGRFERKTQSGIAITQFTKQEIINSDIQFVHDGGEIAPSYQVSVNDGVDSTSPVSAAVLFRSVEDAPVLTANQLTLEEGQRVDLTEQQLSATDADSDVAALTFKVTNVKQGYFAFSSAPNQAITQFSQQQISANEVQFVHDGGELAPAYQISVSDGSLSTAPVAATIFFTSVNDAPFIANPIPDQAIEINQPFSLLIASDVFQDAENDPLTFSASMTDGSALLSGVEFDALNKKLAGKIAQPGSYRFSVLAQDPSLAQARADFSIEVNEKGLNTGLIAGVAGGAAALALGLSMSGLAYFFWRKRKQAAAHNLENGIELVAPERREGYTTISDRFALINKVTKEKAKDLYQQTGIEVTFSEGKHKEKFTLGQGQFGKLRLAQDINTKEFLGVKKIKGETQIADSENEAKLLTQLADVPNIIQLKASVPSVGSDRQPVLYQFLELAGFGSGETLQYGLTQLKDPALKLKLLMHIAKGLLTGLSYMHLQKHIVHLDLKPANFVITQAGEVKIIDFGCAHLLEENKDFMVGGTGDVRYFSPDRLAHVRHSKGSAQLETLAAFDAKKADSWALGLTLLEIATDHNPFAAGSAADKINEWDTAYFNELLIMIPELKEPASGSFWAMVRGLLEPNPTLRLSAKEALANPIFQNAKYQFNSSEEQQAAFAQLKKLISGNPSQTIINKPSLPKHEDRNYLGVYAVNHEHPLDKEEVGPINITNNKSAFFKATQKADAPVTKTHYVKDTQPIFAKKS